MICKHCGGRCVARDEDGWVCINCARPLRPFVSTAPYEPRGADIGMSIERERRFIDSRIAAGKRAW